MSENKIFISHRSTDKDFARILEEFLTKNGIDTNIIFCSSLPGNDCREKISVEIKKAISKSVIDIIILSIDYYDSAYCLNEAGVIWYKDDNCIVIGLPEIDDKTMIGFINDEYKLRRLNNKDDVLAIVGIIEEYFKFSANRQKVDANIAKLISEYDRLIAERTIKIKNKTIDTTNILENKIQNDDLTLDELSLIKFMYDREQHCVRGAASPTNTELFGEFKNWAKDNDYKETSIWKAFELLEKEGIGFYTEKEPYDSFEYEVEFELKIEVFGQLRKISMDSITKIESILKKPITEEQISKKAKESADSAFTNSFSDAECLLIKYCIDCDKYMLLAGWQIDQEEKGIKAWEEINALKNELSSKYESVLKKFSIRKLIVISNTTSYGNPKEYKFTDDAFDSIDNISKEEIIKLEKIVDKYKIIEDEGLLF